MCAPSVVRKKVDSTVLVGLAGLVTTLVASALGLFFTYKARTEPYRGALYAHQVQGVSDLLEATAETQQRVQTFLAATEENAKHLAHEKMHRTIIDVMPLFGRVAGLMPKRFGPFLGNYYRCLTDLLFAVHSHGSLDAIIRSLDVALSQLLDVLREFLRVDQLTDETLSLLKAESLKELLALEESANRLS